MSDAPQPVGLLITSAIEAYKARWRPLTAIGLLSAAPVALLEAGISLATDRDPFVQPASATDPQAAALDPTTLVPALLSLVLFSVASAACVHLVAEGREGRDVSWAAALGFGLSRAAGVLAASLLVLVAVLLGLLALVVPGIWLAVALALTTPALVLERLGPVAAMRRSFALVRGQWWRTAAVVGLGIVLAIGIVLIVVVPATTLALTTDGLGARVAISAIADTIGSALLLPFVVVLLTLLYLDRRDREAAPRFPPRAASPGGEGASFGGFAPPAAPR